MSSLFAKQKRTTKELEDDNANKNRCSNVRDKTQKITQLYSNVSSWNFLCNICLIKLIEYEIQTHQIIHRAFQQTNLKDL